jgi:hypothetical protein
LGKNKTAKILEWKRSGILAFRQPLAGSKISSWTGSDAVADAPVGETVFEHKSQQDRRKREAP